MKLAIDIIQNLLLSKLEKDSNFDKFKIDIAFWEALVSTLLDFEKNPKSTNNLIYSLELNDSERIITKLKSIHTSFVKELAENHVLGISSVAINYLISSENKAFKNDVNFFTNLKNAIKKIERKRIKEGLPSAFDRLTYEITEDEIESVIRKKERESLKDKMKTWDKEISLSDNTPVYSISNNKTTRFIPSSFIKYAASVCINLSVSIQYFNFETQYNFIPTDVNKVVALSVKRKALESSSMKNIVEDIQSIRIEQITTNAVNLNVLKNDYGFAPDKQKIKIVVNDQINRILSLNIAIKQYEKLLKDRKYKPQYNKLKVLISQHETELIKCKNLESKYIFDGKVLTLYSKLKGVQLLEYDGVFYLKRDTNYYKLIISKQPQLFEKIIDSNVLEALEKIIVNNE